MSTAAPVPQDVIDGLRRLRLATIREQAAEVLQTARTQRWPPEDVLRTLIVAEIAGREHANRQIRLKPVSIVVGPRQNRIDLPPR